MVFYRIQAPFFFLDLLFSLVFTSQSSFHFLHYIPFPALLFSPCLDSLVGVVLKYYIFLVYLNCLALLTCFKPGNIDMEQCVCRGIILWKLHCMSCSARYL